MDVGGPALDALRKAASASPDAEVSRRAAELVVRIEDSLDQLLADYRAFGLPLPPDDAPARAIRNGQPSDYEAGYGMPQQGAADGRPPTRSGSWSSRLGRGPAATLCGTVERGISRPKAVGSPIDPRQLTAELPSRPTYPIPPKRLVLALQMHARDWPAAKILFDQGLPREGDPFRPRTALRLLAWDYWDGAIVVRRGRLLACGRPAHEGPPRRRAGTRRAGKSPFAAVPRSGPRAEPAKPGSVESLIDDLIHARLRSTHRMSTSRGSSTWASRRCRPCWNTWTMIV